MRTVMRLALVGLAVGVGLATADPPAATSPLTLQAAVTLDWTGPPAIRLGKPNPFTLTVTNAGRATAQRVTVQVRPPADAVVADAAQAVRAEDGVLVWDVGTLEPGESRPLALTLTAGRRGDFTCPAWVTFTSSAGMAVRVQEPKIDIALKAPATAAIGDPVTVEAVITNTGDSPLEGLDITHASPNVPPVFLAVTPVPVVAEGTTTRTEWCERLAPGQSWTRRFEVTAWNKELPFQVSARCRADEGIRADATAKVKVLSGKLTARLTGPDKLLVGRTGTYTLTVKNVGELTVDYVAPTVPVPSGLRVSAATDGKLDWSLGTLKPGEERQVKFDAVATTVGVQPVTVSVAASRDAKATAEARTAVDGVPALRVELLDTADPVETGKETVYEVRVTNTGTKADENVRVAVEVPEGLRFLSGSGPTDEAGPIARGISLVGPKVLRLEFEPVRELAPKTEAVFRVKVKALTAGDVRFKAVVTSKHLTTPVTKEESTRVYGD